LTPQEEEEGEGEGEGEEEGGGGKGEEGEGEGEGEGKGSIRSETPKERCRVNGRDNLNGPSSQLASSS